MRAFVVAAALGALLAGAAPAGAIVIEAHRGGPLVNGVPTYGENTLPGLAAAAARGDVLEFDVHVTKDGVPVVVHDDTLDRVTDCKGRGPIRTLTLAQVRACRVQFLGRPGEGPSAPDPTPELIPTLSEVTNLAVSTGATISPEIKNIPPLSVDELLTSDFDVTGLVALNIGSALRASGVPQSRIILQSFWPLNLEIARLVIPSAQLSFLTLAALNATGPLVATVRGYGWVSPDFGRGLDSGFLTQARLFKKRIAGYTINTPAGVLTARNQRIDAIITDDPPMARATLG